MQPTGFVHQAAIICPDCAEGLSFPFFDHDKGEMISSTDDMNACFSTDETDSPQYCDLCFEEINSTVISEGEWFRRGYEMDRKIGGRFDY